MKILLVDNFDSFTYNIFQIIQASGHEISIIRNNLARKSLIKRLNPDRIIISPGPGSPDECINSLNVVKDFHAKIPILGICLGHQIIASFFGCKVIQSHNPKHGKTTLIKHDGSVIFKRIPQNTEVGLYNSLIVENKNLPEEITVTALSEEKQIMGIRHRKFPVEGVQFHPDSILTPSGAKMFKNWCDHEYS